MSQKKISQLPQDSSPTITDSIPAYDVETSLTKRSLISDLITLFFNNIPTGAHSDVTRGSETIFDHVATGGVWSADSVGVNKNASMTAMIIYINGRRISISAVTARVFTASKDTYIDVLDNLDGTGTLVYTEVTNNAASPALASNSIRVGIIVTGATTIAAAGSINQGQEAALLPIASSNAYSVTDSLGNLICSRNPQRTTLGYRQTISAFTTTTVSSWVGITGVNIVPFIVPANRKIKVTEVAGNVNMSGGAPGFRQFGVLESSTVITESDASNSANFHTPGLTMQEPSAVSSGLHTYIGSCQQNSAGTMTINGGPATFVKIELV